MSRFHLFTFLLIFPIIANGSIIKGKILHVGTASKIYISYLDFLQQKDITVSSSVVKENGFFEIQINLQEHAWYKINNVLNIFVSPDDSVDIVIEGSTITHATGKNSDNYLLSPNIDFNKLTAQLIVNRNNFLEIPSFINNQKFDSFSWIKERSISTEFKEFLTNELKSKYLSLYFYQLINKEVIIEDIESILCLENRVKHPQESNYRMLSDYFYYLTYNGIILPESHSIINAATRFKSLNFSRTDESFLLLWLYRFAIKSNINSEDHDNLWELLNTISSEEYSLFKNYWHSIYQKKQGLYSNSILNVNLKDYYGNNLSFQEILNKYKGKVFLLDFWAKWCGACIAEFPDIVKLNKKVNNTDFLTVGISVDKSHVDFQVICDKYNLDKSHQYFLGEEENPVRDFFDLVEIPKYYLFEKKSNILLFNDYRPMHSEMFKSVIKACD